MNATQMQHAYNHDVIIQNIQFLVLIVMLAIFLIVARSRSKILRKRRYPRRSKLGRTDYGDAGEQMVQYQLKFLGLDYVVLHDILLHGGGQRQQIDHLVIGPNGVFHIESKHWAGVITFNRYGMQHIKKGVATNDSDPTAQVERHDYVVRSILQTNNLNVDAVGIICFTHPRCQLTGASPSYATIKLDRLLSSIKQYRPKKQLTRKQIQTISQIFSKHSQRTPAGYGQ